jgi:hypothetical protein
MKEDKELISSLLKKQRTCNEWTAEEDDQLVALLKRGLTTSSIVEYCHATGIFRKRHPGKSAVERRLSMLKKDGKI